MLWPVIILTLFWQSCCWVEPLHAADADVLWNRAVSMAQQGQMDLAFSNFRMIIDSYPDSNKGTKAHLGAGEYYALQNDFTSASKEFEEASKNIKEREAFIALAYLYKIAQLQSQKEAAARYQKQLFSSHPFALVFKNSQSFECVSGLQHKYKMVFHIERIEVFKDGKLFVEILS